MKTNDFPRCDFLRRAVATSLLLTSPVLIFAMAGCGFADSSETLDRVPNVPASTRAGEGAAVADPAGR